jgi:hypothetical protein
LQLEVSTDYGGEQSDDGEPHLPFLFLSFTISGAFIFNPGSVASHQKWAMNKLFFSTIRG